MWRPEIASRALFTDPTRSVYVTLIGDLSSSLNQEEGSSRRTNMQMTAVALASRKTHPSERPKALSTCTCPPRPERAGRTIPSSSATEAWSDSCYQPLQWPNQQEASPEFPSQEISCEEALTAQTKSPSALHGHCPRGPRQHGQKTVMWVGVGGDGAEEAQPRKKRRGTRVISLSLGLGFVGASLTHRHELDFTSWPAASPWARMNLEGRSNMRAGAASRPSPLPSLSLPPTCIPRGTVIITWEMLTFM